MYKYFVRLISQFLVDTQLNEIRELLVVVKR